MQEQSVEDLVIDGSTIRGVKTANEQEISATQVVITTGTFLRAICHIGHKRYAAGRHIRDSSELEPPSIGLAKTLENFKLSMGRYTTGTPARIDRSSINYEGLGIQESDSVITPFSFVHEFNAPFIPPNPLRNKHTFQLVLFLLVFVGQFIIIFSFFLLLLNSQVLYHKNKRKDA